MNKKQLSLEVVEQIFKRLHGRFGNQFIDKFSIGEVDANGEDYGILNAKQVWAEELGHLSFGRLKVGMSAKFNYPPSCDEFVLACKNTPAMYQDNLLITKRSNIEYADKQMQIIRDMFNIKTKG
jgi:hypothetical protein